MLTFLVEENEIRPWQLKFFVRVDNIGELDYLENELFKRRWKCIEWRPSKKTEYNYFTYVQKPKNLEKEDFICTLSEIIPAKKRSKPLPYNRQHLFELIQTGDFLQAEAMLSNREGDLGVDLLNCLYDDEDNEAKIDIEDCINKKIEVERFWAYLYFKSGRYSDINEYFENVEDEHMFFDFLPSIEEDTVSLYYRMLCNYRLNNYEIVLGLGKCWLDRYAALKETGCIPDAETQIDDIVNMMKHSIKFGEEHGILKEINNYITTYKNRNYLRHTSL